MVHGKQFVGGIIVGHVDIQGGILGAVGKSGEFTGGGIQGVPRQRRGARGIGLGIVCAVGHCAGAYRIGLADFDRRRGVSQRE